MALTATAQKLLNRLSIAFAKEKVGDQLAAAASAATTAKAGTVKMGVAVANAAGANPTAAEYQALLDSLRNAGVISMT